MRLRNICVLVLAVLTVASTTIAVRASGGPGDPAEGAAQVAFHAVRASEEETENVPLVGYEGEHLTVTSVDVGRRAAEPMIGVTTDGTAFFTAGNFDSVGGRLARTELLRSVDRGLSWQSVQTPNEHTKSEPAGSLDPYVWVDTDTDRVFNLDLLGCGYLQVSDDLGESWETSLAACGDSVDHQSLFGGPRPEGLALPLDSDYPNVLYYCTNRVLDSRCGRSLDGGATWVTTLTPAYLGFDPAAGGMCNGLHGHGVVDREGRVYLPKGHCGNPWISISEDGGDTWTQVRVSTKEAGRPVVPVLRYAGTFAHTSVAVDAAGNLYYVWPDRDMRPWLSVSRDQGRTWEEPMLVAPPGVQETNFPTIDAGDEGHIAIIFVGSPASSPGAGGGGNARRPWNHYVLASTNALDENPLFLSTTSHNPSDPIHRGDCFSRCGGMFDFLDVVVAPSGEIWATASDTCVRAACVQEGGQVDPDAVGRGLAVRQVDGPLLRAPSEPSP